MDQRKKTIQELEDRKRAETEARNRLLEKLGGALIQRIGAEEPFTESAENTPGGILAEYRALLAEIDESKEAIKSLEADRLRLKELEEEISAKEAEQAGLEKELDGFYVLLGKARLASFSDSENYTGSVKWQEENLLAKIEEQEKKLKELEEREGGILAWLGKNAQMAVSKTLLLRNRSALTRLYRAAGEKFLSEAAESGGSVLDGEAAETMENARGLKGRISELETAFAALRGERRKIADVFGAEGSPSRRIQGLEKHIAHVYDALPALYLRFGVLAGTGADDEAAGKEAFAMLLSEDDRAVLEKAAQSKSKIDAAELEIRKIKAAISIDNEKTEIEKLNKSILYQKQKITAAEEAIGDLEHQIAESEKSIVDLKQFIDENGGM